jgi:hypothetical protein
MTIQEKFDVIAKRVRLDICIGDVVTAATRLHGFVQNCELNSQEIPDPLMDEIERLAGSCAAVDMRLNSMSPTLALRAEGLLC